MPGIPASASSRPSKITIVAAGIASLLFVFLFENLFLDARLRHRSHRIPSFIPTAQTAAWFAAFVIGAMALILLIVCMVLVLKERSTPLWMKSALGGLVFVVLLLSAEWTLVTNGRPGFRQLLFPKRTHKVVLTWQASSSAGVAGYNVYRKTSETLGYLKLNAAPIKGLTYTDPSVENGATYSYVARSVDSLGDESANSNVFRVSIP